ncbi:hypothetical protein [Deinococcus pimensis]|uniref:hypothetical protein n=1 Tax=Deinococcus pimensis TaxID=309888 RepID=UPI000487D5A6|nr:hypothetical protein [Deinococcus pimensis]
MKPFKAPRKWRLAEEVRRIDDSEYFQKVGTFTTCTGPCEAARQRTYDRAAAQGIALMMAAPKPVLLRTNPVWWREQPVTVWLGSCVVCGTVYWAPLEEFPASEENDQA